MGNAMTEQDWLACDDPAKMLRLARFTSYPRKSRLFAVACCRCNWDLLLDERSRLAVEVAERFADGAATDEETRIASQAAQQAHREMFDTVGKVGSCIEWACAYTADPHPFRGARNVTWMAATPRMFEVRHPRPNGTDEIRLFPCMVTRTSGLSHLRGKWQVDTIEEAVPTGADAHVQAALLRDIFGPLPFRTKTIAPGWLSWNGGVVRLLAVAAYDGRLLPSGQLDLTRLAVLADALEEAGCDDAEVLSHLRGPGPHVRGCWCVDLLLDRP
jgi:hypothetical protein